MEMTEEQAKQIIEQLRQRKIEEYMVQKEDFLVFRSVLVAQEDFKHFRGEAQRGGHVLVTYLDTPGS
jgi:hypothetical protein